MPAERYAPPVEAVQTGSLLQAGALPAILAACLFGYMVWMSSTGALLLALLRSLFALLAVLRAVLCWYLRIECDEFSLSVAIGP